MPGHRGACSKRKLDEAEQRRLIDEALADVDFSSLERGAPSLVAADAAATTYANALYEAAQDAGRLDEVRSATCRRVVRALAREAVARARALQPRVPVEAKRRIIAQLAAGRRRARRQGVLSCCSTTAASTLLPDLERGVRRALRARAARARGHADHRRSRSTTPRPTTCAGASRRRPASTSTIERRVDPAILGGVVLRMRDRLVDASVRARARRAAPLPAQVRLALCPS